MAKKAAEKAVDKKPPTKTQIIAELAEKTGLAKKDVATLFDALTDMIKKNLGNKGPGEFTMPGLLKIVKKHVPRKPAQKNVFNPLTKTYADRPAKPAHNTIKVRPLKALKEMV